MITLQQLARSYGLGLGELSTVVGIAGVDPQGQLSNGQATLIMQLVESCGLFGSDTSRHVLPTR